jgi:hypothetical protein
MADVDVPPIATPPPLPPDDTPASAADDDDDAEEEEAGGGDALISLLVAAAGGGGGAALDDIDENYDKDLYLHDHDENHYDGDGDCEAFDALSELVERRGQRHDPAERAALQDALVRDIPPPLARRTDTRTSHPDQKNKSKRIFYIQNLTPLGLVRVVFPPPPSSQVVSKGREAALEAELEHVRAEQAVGGGARWNSVVTHSLKVTSFFRNGPSPSSTNPGFKMCPYPRPLPLTLYP